MKKASVLFCCFLIPSAFFMFTVSANAQKITKKEVPSAVISAFENDYPNAKIKNFSKEERTGNTVYEIESVDGKTRRNIIYSTDGVTLDIEERIAPAKLPDSVKQAIDREYPESKVKSADRFIKVFQAIEYEVVIKQGKKTLEVVFDEKGNVLKTTKP
jgi:hypothetical protein